MSRGRWVNSQYARVSQEILPNNLNDSIQSLKINSKSLTHWLLNNFFDFFHFWHDCWPWHINYLIRFWSIFVVTLTLKFQGQIWNLLYLSQKWSDCHEMKSKHIDWTPGLRCDLGHDLDLQFSRSNIEFAISQPKMVWLPRNEEQTYRLNSMPQIWPPGSTLAMTLTFNCMEFAISQPKVVRLPRNEKQTYQINWTPGLKCDQWVWPWPWPWSLNFEGLMWP